MSPPARPSRETASPEAPPLEMLREIAARFGTPAYAYDAARVRLQVRRLRSALPEGTLLFYSLKANPSLALSALLARCGLGADVASAGELATALAAGFGPAAIFVSGPYKAPETLAHLRDHPRTLVSVDSAADLRALAAAGVPCRALLRLRPDFEPAALVAAGPASRFGISLDEVPGCRELAGDAALSLAGFHVFCGSQVLDAAAVARQLDGAAELCLRAAAAAGRAPEVLNLGGGFGIPYRPEEAELDLRPVGDALERVRACLHPARICLELGRYLVAPAGWYLTRVVGHQTHEGRPALVVDGGTHQRADLCCLNLRRGALSPLPLGSSADGAAPRDVLGCLSAPGDVLSEAALLPPLAVGEVLAYPNAGAYGLAASPFSFHGSVPPAEVLFDGGWVAEARPRLPAAAVLAGQALPIPPAREGLDEAGH